MLEIGAYPVSVARKIAGAAAGKLFLDPVDVRGTGKVGSTGVDHIAAASLRFENDIVAEVSCAVECALGSRVEIYGTGGLMTIPVPWLPSSPCRHAKEPLPANTPIPHATLVLQVGGETSEIEVEADRDLFTYEADTVAKHIVDRQAPVMSWDDSLGNMRTLDRWREEVGVVY